jgi:hypothetical protein
VANLAALKREIPSASLTPTFRDAIAITRLLETRYLWIDALCIVQDDKADWEREAAKMASVFRCAYVTLAAASPMAKGNGLELADLPPSTQFRVRPNRKSGDPESQDLRILLRPPEAAGLARLDLFYDSPMHGRGWIFQEMVLSSRIVHFVDGQFFWQCQSVFESEDRTMQVNDRQVEWSLNTPYYPNYLVSSTRSLDGPMANGDAIKRDFTWWTWVLEHSSRKLTNPNDDLPSLAGAVDFYRRLSGDEPVVGLWLKEIAFYLSWQVITTDKVPSREPGQPSWSWTSIPHAHRGRNLGIRHLPLANPPSQWHIVDPSNGVAPDDLVGELGTGMVVMWSLQVTSDAVTVQWTGEPYVSRLRCAELLLRRSRLFDNDSGFVDVERESKLRERQGCKWDFKHLNIPPEDESDSDDSVASGYWTPDQFRPRSGKTLSDKELQWWEGTWSAWSVPTALFDSSQDERAAMADLARLITLPIWIRHRYESQDLGQYYYQEKEYCYLFEVCSLLLLPVENTDKYRRVGVSSRLFDCGADKFAETRNWILGKVEEYETVVLV